MPEDALVNAINEALVELDPYATDTLVESQDEDLVDLELDGDPTAEDEESESDIVEGEEEDSEDASEDADDSDKHIVKVDGEEFEVSIDELKAGYSRQAHFTKLTQALKEERAEFENEIAQYNATLEQVTQLDAAWESDHVGVLTNLLASTENPSYTIGLLIKQAAANDLFTPEALQYFGIDADTKQAWTAESEVEALKRRLQEKEEAESTRASQEQDHQAEARVQEAMQIFEDQISDIIAEEDLDLPTSIEKANFKADLLRFAKDNQILDLKKAYAALAYEQAKEAKKANAKREQSTQKKTATKVVSRGGAGATGVTPATGNNLDLRSVIESTMKDLQF